MKLPSASHCIPGRPGVAAIWALAILAVLAVIMALTTWQSAAMLRQVERRQNQLQADWLARSGIELAAARLLADPAEFKEETVEIIPQSKVRIGVETKADAPGLFWITCEARYPADERSVVLRTATRCFRRVTDKDRVRLEVVQPDKERKN